MACFVASMVLPSMLISALAPGARNSLEYKIKYKDTIDKVNPYALSAVNNGPVQEVL